MFRVITCITTQHDPYLVVLAAVVCLFAAITALGLAARAVAAERSVRLAWIAAGALAAGIGIWATHFVAMIAFRPGLPHGYDLGLTVLSVVIAMVLCFAGLWLALWRDPQSERLLAGGAVLGFGISAMHFTGMAALRIPADIHYDPTLATAALIIGMVFGALALHTAFRKLSLTRLIVGALLLMLAICGMHFTAMASAVLTPNPAIVMPPGLLSPAWLSLYIAAASIAVLSLGILGAAIDRRIAARFAVEAGRFEALASAALEGILIHSRGLIVDANEAFARLVGSTPEALIGTRALDIVAPEHHPLVSTPESFRNAELIEIDLIDREGNRHPVEMRGRAINYQGRSARVSAVRDLAERRQAEERIRHMAHHDALTGLPNRTLFRDRLTQAVARAARSGEAVAVLCLDLDRFKSVNDLLGHPSGDALLAEVAARLTETLREMDTVARLGGDEFAIVQVGLRQPENAASLAHRLVKEMALPFDLDGQEMVIGTSIGIALFPSDAQTPDDLLKNADTALYRAKADGRGIFRFFEATMDALLQERRALERDLRHAIAARQLSIHYQPLVDCSSGRAVGFEALVRWEHATRGQVSPVDFIPVAEESGLIMPLGEWVLRSACVEAAKWPGDLRIAVNLSPAQFRHADLPKLVADIIAEAGLSAERLELEITEGLLIDDTDRAFATLTALKTLGVRISLDDFGTGYSSLGYLQRFPFDKIKIDRSFIQGLENSRDAMAIVRTVITLGQNLGMTVTAEGIETPEQYEMLRRENCHQVQGFLLGRPGPAMDIPAVLERLRSAETAEARAGDVPAGQGFGHAAE